MAEPGAGFDSRGLGLRAQKKLLGKMSSKKIAMSFIDETTGRLLDNAHRLLRQYKGSKKEADKLLKYIIKSVVKIGILYKNDQFNREELNSIDQFKQKFHSLAMTVVSFHQPPKELVTDVVKLWKSLQQAFLHSQIRDYGQIKKILTGQPLDTNVCCDNQVVRCYYGASHITPELVSHLDHIKTDDTKRKKSVDAPEVCAGVRKCSRSIGSSVKTLKSAWTQLFACSTSTSDTRQSLHSQKPSQKRCFAPDNCPTAISSSSYNSPAKRRCQETVNSKISLAVAGNQKLHDEAGCEALLTSNKSSANVDSGFIKTIHPRGLPSHLQDPAMYDVENKENLDSATCDIQNKDSTHHTSHFNGKTDPGNSCMLQPHLVPDPVTNTHQQESGTPEITVEAHTTSRLIPDVFHETSV